MLQCEWSVHTAFYCLQGLKEINEHLDKRWSKRRGLHYFPFWLDGERAIYSVAQKSI